LGSIRGLAYTLVVAAAVCGSIASSSAASSAPAAVSYREQSFDSDPQWEGVDNRDRRCIRRSFSFGLTEKGFGGQFPRSSFYRAYYAKVLDVPRTLDDTLTASGTIRMEGPSGGGVLFGWFNSATSFDWRTTDFLGLRLDGHGSVGRLYGEYGTKNALTGAVIGARISPNREVRWSLEYLPDAGDYASGLFRLTVGSNAAEVSVRPEHRAEGATFDRFGFLNVQVFGSNINAYAGDLTLDGAPMDPATEPDWEGSNNTLRKAQDCIVRNNQDFGYSPETQFAGGDPGEIGGVIWRAQGHRSSYADPTAELGLDDVLYAEGTLALERASVDSDLFIGWFHTSSRKRKGEGMPTDILVAGLGGPSEWGYRLYPVYHTSGDIRDSFGQARKAPRVTPKHHPWRWWICYLPVVNAEGNGRMTVGVEDPAGEYPTTVADIPVPVEAKEVGADFNRFGIRNFEEGGHMVDVYLDDLRYTVGPGDVPPPGRCET
jgi:hypothetical protein